MNHQPRSQRRRSAPWIIGLVLLPLALSACAGARTPSTSWPGVTVADGTAYVAFGPSITAVDLDSGDYAWDFTPEGELATNFYAAPAVDNGILYAGSYDGWVFALDASQQGVIVWRQQVSSGRFIASPVIADNTLLLPSTDRHLYALDRESGRVNWKFPADQPLERPIWAAVHVEAPVVYLAGLDHHLYAVDLADGSLIWDRPLEGALADRPASLNGLLLVGTFGDALHAIDKRSGEIEWSFETEDWVWGNPVVNGGVAYFGDVAGNLYAVNESGQLVFDEALEGQIAASPAALDGQLVLVTDDGGVFARSSDTGEPLWEQRIDGRLLSDPAIVDDTVLVAALDGEDLLTAFNSQSGAIRWTFSPAQD